jgi:hypothetical protein
VFNRPGLPRLAYRVGTYATFREAMVEHAARAVPLRDWTSRTDDDLGMALLDCWAYVADVLTFYTERAANESYLRTARLRDSVLRLAALLGYRPAPGLSAQAQLVLTLDRDRALTVLPGLRVKSVPRAGERAVTFETSEPLWASAALNAVPVRGELQDFEPWRPSGGVPASDGPVEPPFSEAARAALRPGTEILVFATDAAAAEEKRVVSLTERGPLLDLRFEPPAASPDFQFVTPVISRWSRRLRLFGHDAPPSWLRQYVDANGEVRFERLDEGDPGYDLRVPGGATLRLDRVVDGLQQGADLLIASPPLVARRTVRSVTTVAASAGPISATVTEVTLDSEVFSAGDAARPTVRQVTVYELHPPDVTLWRQDLPRMIGGSRVLVPLPADPPAIPRGRTVVLDDAAHQPVTTTVVATAGVALYGGGPPDHLLLSLDPALPRDLDAASAFLHANVVTATHGETVARERLGAGDMTVPFQRFALAKPPLTHVRRAGAPGGAAPELEVRVAGLRWQLAQRLFGHGPGDRVYVLELADDGTTTVRFGDSVTGQAPATGAEIVARYRQGIGREGLVHAGQLTLLLDRPLGLRTATNPLPAAGAADPETLDQARTNAPETVRTFDRVVSLRDFEDAARASALVAKARAAFATVGGEPAVVLTVAGEDGAHLDATARRDLRADLDARRDPWRRLEIVDYTEIPVVIKAAIVAHDPARLPEDVAAAATAALLGALSFARREFGQPLHASGVFAALQSATGVVGVDLQRLQYRDDADRSAHGAGSEPVLAHLPIGPNELATLDPADLTVVVT